MKKVFLKTTNVIIFVFLLTNIIAANDDNSNKSYIYTGISTGSYGRLLMILGFYNSSSNLSFEANGGWFPYGLPYLENGNSGINLNLNYKIFEKSNYKVNSFAMIGIYENVLGYVDYQKNEDNYSYLGIGLKQEYKNVFLSTGLIYKNYSHVYEAKKNNFSLLLQLGYLFKFY